jgi:hypothetical protein
MARAELQCAAAAEIFKPRAGGRKMLLHSVARDKMKLLRFMVLLAMGFVECCGNY